MTQGHFLPMVAAVFCILILLLEFFCASAHASITQPTFSSKLLEFPSCSPESSLIERFVAPPTSSCSKAPPPGRRKRAAHCSKGYQNYCAQISPEQNHYINAVREGKISNVLAHLVHELGRRGDQAKCSVNDGYLVRGRPIVSTPTNRIMMRSPEFCFNFGTDYMAAMIEWLGQEVAKAFSGPAHSGVRLIVGDVTGPKGGCLANRSGRRRHASHTNGQDADLGFLTVREGESSPIQFPYTFDALHNWWLFKKVFKNPYACVKVIFLDRRHISALARVAKGDEDWNALKRFIRHMPGHKNHFHIRIGSGPGRPGCTPGARPELETEEDFDTEDPDDSEILNQLRGPAIQ